MSYWLLLTSFLGSGLISKVKKINWQNLEDKLIKKYGDTELLKKLLPLFIKSLRLSTFLFELLFKYAILGTIAYLIYKGVGVNEAYFYLLITLIIRLGFINDTLKKA